MRTIFAAAASESFHVCQAATARVFGATSILSAQLVVEAVILIAVVWIASAAAAATHPHTVAAIVRPARPQAGQSARAGGRSMRIKHEVPV